MTEIPFGVRPTIERAASPKARISPVLSSRAIYAGSSNTNPLPFAKMRIFAVPKSIPKSKFKDRFKRLIKSPTCSGRTKRFNVMAGVVLAIATVSRLRRSARRIFVTLIMVSRILEAK